MNHRLLILFSLLSFFGPAAEACTTIVVGKNASTTGRVIVGHNEDTSLGSTFTRHTIARSASGDLAHQWIETRDEKGCHSPACDSFLNECGVLVVSNNALCEPCDDPSKLTDGGVLWKLRQSVGLRARSARDAVTIITNLVSTYGYRDAGRIYTVADANEAWQVIVVYGKRFVARRCPDDKVTMTANCCTIRTFEPGDIRSADFADKPADFDFAKACQKRGAWNSPHYLYRWRYMMKFFTEQEVPREDYPYAVVPSRKIDARALQTILKSHFEGTPDEIPLGPDGFRHDESARTGLCRAKTLYSGIWTFGPTPREVHLDFAAGSPCCHPYE